MKRFIEPRKEEWPGLLTRPLFDYHDLRKRVGSILADVRAGGLEAALRYALEFDGHVPDPLAVPADEIIQAADRLPAELRSAIDRAARNIEIFHRNQQQTFPVVYISRSIQCWQKEVPVERVGFYIPGGSAPLFSTVLMLGIPARIAGCQEIQLCTPAGADGSVHPAILYAASVCGISSIFKLGGVQAIGAMAYGAGPVSAVDKIYGPGNQYVTMAKQLVSEEGIAIDMPAGPSEVLVMADDQADPRFVAADLLSQAEHGEDSQVVLLCQSEDFADRVDEETSILLSMLPRAAIARTALEKSLTVVFASQQDMMEFSNRYAPEHLIISTENARMLAGEVRNAGSVFIGAYTPESAGDYASGTNHTLPTNGFARAYSGLTLQSFLKTIQFQEIQQDGLADLGPDIIRMADAEGLKAHSLAVQIRLEN